MKKNTKIKAAHNGNEISLWESARIKTNFDFDWRFFKGDAQKAYQIDFNDAEWRNLNLPHDWSIEGPFSEDNPTGKDGGYLPAGIGWYRKAFQLPHDYSDKKIIIEFDGVYMNSDVWINNNHLGRHPYGYTSFYYDLTPYLKYGGRENVIAVKVDNSKQPNSRWYSGSGIYRHVWLTATNKVHIAHWGTYITCSNVSNKSATVTIKTKVKNETDAHQKIHLLSAIINKKRESVQVAETSQDISSGTEYEFVQTVEIKKPDLWSPDNPCLYEVYSQVKEGNEILDDYKTPFGIRDFNFDANRGFFLSGRNMKFKGVCLHHDCGCLGAACPDRANERKIEILKDIGCNAIRTSHNPPTPELLDYCDHYGMLVMDEAFDEWKDGKLKYGYHEYFDEWAIADLKSMIHRDRNHPSIIMWSVGNEIPEQKDPNGTDILKKLVDVAHKEDPTRPVTSACNFAQEANETGFFDQLDIAGYNYRENFYKEDHKKYPDRKITGSETTDYPLGNWLVVKENDFVTGEFLWTGMDYLGESGIGGKKNGWPYRAAMCGLFDLSGFKKPRCYFRQSLWSDKPMVYIACDKTPKQGEKEKETPPWGWPDVVSCWNWEEGETISVKCYSNCNEVELFLNGKSLGSKEISKATDLRAIWDIPFEAGILKAVGKKQGKEVCAYESHTAGKPAKIALTPDRNIITADGRDLSHISVEILDKNNILAPYASNSVDFDIQEEGEIIGLGGGNQMSHEDYKSNKRKAYHGKCLAIVQSTRCPGKIHITAASPGLVSGNLTIITEA